MDQTLILSTLRSRTARIAISIVSLALLGACESNPTEATSKQAAANNEHCFVTGSNLRQRDCRNADVRTLSREDAERIQSQSMIIPAPRN